MIGLTAKQMATLRFVAGFVEAKGRSPTLGEMASGLGFASKSRAHYSLRHLIERGAIARNGSDIEFLRPVAIPRAPDGPPLYFVRIPQ